MYLPIVAIDATNVGGVNSHCEKKQQRAAKSRKEQQRAAKSSKEQQRTAKNSKEQQRTAKSSKQQQRTANNSKASKQQSQYKSELARDRTNQRCLKGNTLCK